jgi:uncharacterized DUF497 family protein
MKFEWDDTKCKSNIEKHGIDFIDAQTIFAGYTLTIQDDRHDYGEERFVTFGILDGRVVVVIHTETENSIRIISIERQQNMKKRHISLKSQTDWERVDKLQDNDIDFSDNPEITPEMFAKAIIRKGLKPVVRKNQITLRIDEDVLAWFKKQGTGYQTRINSLLKAYKEAHQIKSGRTST